MKQKKDWTWQVLFVIVAALCGWLVWQKQQAGPVAAKGDFEPLKILSGDVAGARSYELSQVGKPLVWSKDFTVLGEGEPLASLVGRARLVMAVSELSCSTCRDEQTAFVLKMAEKYGKDSVTFVVRSGQPRFARAYMRLNGIDLPVHYDPEGVFFDTNGISDTPMLMQLNAHGEVVAAHFPLPDKIWWSQPFHGFVARYLAENGEVQELEHNAGGS